MATLLELQELFRNVSDPDVEELLRISPKETRWMVMDEKRRRGEMREAEKAALAESDIKPRNMLEEYQSTASSVLGGQPLGDIGQQDQGQYGEMESSGGPDPYADQQAEVPGFALGALVPAGAAVGRAAAASSIPWLAKLAKRLGAKVAPPAPKPALGPAPIPPGWERGPFGVPMPPSGGPAITTPFGPMPVHESVAQRIAGLAAPSRSAPDAASVLGGAAGAAGEAAKKSWMSRHKLLTGGAAALGASYMMGDDEEGEGVPGLGGVQVDQDAPQGSDQYLKLLRRVMDRGDELQERIGDSRISDRDKFRRTMLAASGAMLSTPGYFQHALGNAFTAASDELGAISVEENDMLRTAVSEYQVGSASVSQLVAAIAAINKSMQAGGRGAMTDTMLIKLLNEQGIENIAGIMDQLAQARAIVSGQGQYAQTDYDHSTLGSASGTD